MKNIRPQEGAQTRFLQSSADIAITGGSAFGGKAVEINTLIPTERGFVRMGEIKPGHRVFAIDGTLSTVLEAFEITLHEDAYEVEFDSGEVFVVDGDHLWKTMTYNERIDAFHRTEEFRDRRRANRPSRAKEVKKNYGASLTITRINQEREYEYLEPSDGEVRTTSEILETLKVRSDRVNHSVALAKPIELPHNEFIIDPYLFGLWLGDGCASVGLVGCAEEDMNVMLKHIKLGKVIYEKVECNPPRKTPYKSVRFEGLTSYIRKYGLYKNKHIPIEYLRSSKEQRIELLRGLMDTDGTCDKNGKCSISLSDERLIKDVQELICSLGIRCSYHTKPIPGYKTSYGISFTADFSVFHLQRKKDRQQMRKVRSERRYIVDVRKTEPCFMRCIRIDHPSHLYLMGRTFVPTHNTYSLLLEAARHVGHPKYQGIIFRRESVQITSPGGLRDTSMDVYPHLGGLYRAQPTPRWIFPSGAQITFAHLNNEDTVLNYQGSQMTLIAYDELTHFSRFQFFYMLSRARSMSGIKPYIRGSTNPDSDSWVAE
ncbi:MAG: terminase family protein, partial [Streptococcus sp.]|nr:terminase family protein [Streptococcus sp.]